MDDPTKLRIRHLMFHVVPDPDEIITDGVLERSEEVDYEEEKRMKAEFRHIVESLEDLQDVRQVVLAALDDMDASGKDVQGDLVEWTNVRDVMGRRIRQALSRVL